MSARPPYDLVLGLSPFFRQPLNYRLRFLSSNTTGNESQAASPTSDSSQLRLYCQSFHHCHQNKAYWPCVYITRRRVFISRIEASYLIYMYIYIRQKVIYIYYFLCRCLYSIVHINLWNKGTYIDYWTPRVASAFSQFSVFLKVSKHSSWGYAKVDCRYLPTAAFS